ncbi:carboxy-S-adenosyl-L-methionine synthase CmoA [Candidatus Profftia tarda]|uniref:Carboxy-S-adenosyl-L-methionine synthase n=1 Tax=Candidatus Profftia tarda TaxID=1177216 RepID=A0A8E4F176_9ENTR|nr:carboxy-S-adenosyl-L-methionine synthase CmoA [Candidatus Profftia tarda]CAD6509044.1 tRNA (cmo5U34)-methyltransferase [Candidatus Profftia tarda]
MSNCNNTLYSILNSKIGVKRDTLFSTPLNRLYDWTFDEHIAEVFHDMLQRSVPGYSNIISMIGMLAERFVQPNTKVYDLGCSLGAATFSICRKIRAEGCQVVAVDNSPAMVQRFRRHLHSFRLHIPVEIIEACIQNISIENASMVVLNFTLQFLTPIDRQSLLNKIYQGLLPRGIIVLSEKLHFEDNTIGELFFNMHDDFKRLNGYTDLEITQKRKMLKNVMFTDSIDTHKIRLNNAGFKHVEIWFQYFNFGSLLAVK